MSQHVAMAPNGRLVIPANVRSELGMQDGGKFIVHVQNGEIRLEPINAAITRAQAIVRRYVPKTASLVGELTEDRRRESDAESE
jgi:AbrB family looped-hinge helix DNA binding protein